MSELNRSGAGGEANKPTPETRPATQADHQSARDAADHNQDIAAIEARLDEADLPTRVEARAAAREPDSAEEYNDYDEHDFGPESDAVIEAHLDEAGLPTRAEARATARRSDAADEDEYGEHELSAEYDADPDTLPAEDVVPGNDQAQTAAGDASPGVGSPDDPPAEASDSRTVRSTEVAERATVDNSDRVAKLEAENTRLVDIVTDLQVRMERQEQGKLADPYADLTNREQHSARRDDKKADARQLRRRRLPTDEALAVGAAAVNVIPAISDHIPFLHGDIAGITASAVAVGAAALTWKRARSEASHVHRSED